MTAMECLARRVTTARAPRYELRVIRAADCENRLEIWQLPGPMTPHLRRARRVAGLGGRNLALIEHRVLHQLKADGVDTLGVARGSRQRFDLSEESALRLGLAFRALAPMRNRAHMRAVASGIEAMAREEAAYWLGMAMHRTNPRRVLTALRTLLTDPGLD